MHSLRSQIEQFEAKHGRLLSLRRAYNQLLGGAKRKRGTTSSSSSERRFKFKDKHLWNLQNQFEWSSQAINSIASFVWDENERGKLVTISLTNYVSTLGYDYYVVDADLSSSFSANAFEDSESLPRRSKEEEARIRERKKRKKLRREDKRKQRDGASSASSAGASSANHSAGKMHKDVHVYIFGETDHNAARPDQEEIKKLFLKKGYFILGEGLSSGEHTSDLDSYEGGFRVDILIASLFTKTLDVLSKPHQYDHHKNQRIKVLNMVVGMLKNPKSLPVEIGKLITKENWRKNFKTFIPIIQDYEFQFQDIYDYYFPNDANQIKSDMTTLLNLNSSSSADVLFIQTDRFKKEFKSITQDARENDMLDLIRTKARAGKVAVFTGAKHLPKLTQDVSKEFMTKSYRIPSKKTLREIRTILS